MHILTFVYCFFYFGSVSQIYNKHLPKKFVVKVICCVFCLVITIRNNNRISA